MTDLPASGRAPEEIRRAVDDVLSRPEFADAQPGLAGQVWDWLLAQLARLLSLVGSSDPGQLLLSLVLFAIIAGLAAAAVVFVRRIRRSGAPAREGVTAPVGRSPAQWRDAARAAEVDGDLREAVRCAYRALVADFAARGWLEEVPGRTAGQYLAAVEADVPAAAPAFARVTRLFERAWYGRAGVAPADLRRLEHDADAALAAGSGGRSSESAPRIPVGA